MGKYLTDSTTDHRIKVQKAFDISLSNYVDVCSKIKKVSDLKKNDLIIFFDENVCRNCFKIIKFTKDKLSFDVFNYAEGEHTYARWHNLNTIKFLKKNYYIYRNNSFNKINYEFLTNK